jgi:hypothetical protein
VTKLPADYQLIRTIALTAACDIEGGMWTIFLAAEPHEPIIARTMRLVESRDTIHRITSPGEKTSATITGTFNRKVSSSHTDYSVACKCWICKLVRRVRTLGAGRICIPSIGLKTAECLSKKPDVDVTPTASVVHAFASVGIPVFLYTNNRGVQALHFQNYAAAIPNAVPLLPPHANDRLCDRTRHAIYHNMTCTPVDPANALDATRPGGSGRTRSRGWDWPIACTTRARRWDAASAQNLHPTSPSMICAASPALTGGCRRSTHAL